MKKIVETEPKKKVRKALTPEAREQQLIAMATDLAEQQLRDGTASSQVITHFLKLGTMEKKLEMKNLETEIGLKNAKKQAIEGSQRVESLYADALKAMKQYSGQDLDQ